MDPGWRFHLGDIPFGTPKTVMDCYSYNWAKSGAFQGAAQPDFDDASWRAVDLPHDWAVEGAFDPDLGPSHGYLPTGIGWYRKRFVLPASDEGRRLLLEFDGIFRDATVFLNGHRVGHESSGYIGTHYDVTDQVLYGEDNVLAVRVDARETEGWWYEGAGIYRHVWLTKTNPVHVAPWGVFVTAVPASEGKTSRADITAEVAVANDTDEVVQCEVEVAVLGATGTGAGKNRAALSLAAGQTATVTQNVAVRAPHLWSVDDPYLYRLHTTIHVGGKAVDALDTSFGVRTIRFDANDGFFLNGKPLKLKGASNHQDHAGVGVALPDRLYAFRVERLKEMGANAWRCAHNPPAPEFLDACDRLGMLVMDETRCMNSTPHGLHQLESMVRRDRNHPSVIFWSLGNEEFLQGSLTGKRIIRSMKRRVRRLDATRPVTLAMNGGWGQPVSPELDVMGCNYAAAQYDDYHKNFPAHPMFGSETSATLSTRGEYETSKERGVYSAYDGNSPGFGGSAEASWKAVAERKFVAGTFPWTGFDYRGEPAPYVWPCVSSNFGIVDTCGFPKDNFYYYQAWWSDRVVLHLFPHWTWPERVGQEVAVWCHTNCDAVELFLNGKSVGRQDVAPNSHVECKVKYAPGTLTAKGFKGGKRVAEQSVHTTGAPARLVLEPDRSSVHADGEDVSMVTVSVVDEAGRVVPYAANDVHFTIAGPGHLLGVGNGDPASHEPDKLPRRRVFHGLCMAFLQAGREAGTLTLIARSPGLPDAECVIRVARAVAKPCVWAVDSARRLDLFKVGTAKTRPEAEIADKGRTGAEFSEVGWQVVSLVDKLKLASPSCLRIRFVVPESMPAKGMILDLGAIHDFDETWLNGVRIGSVGPDKTAASVAWQTPRRYAIPAGLLRPGRENVLAIRAWNHLQTSEARTFLPGPMQIRPVEG